MDKPLTTNQKYVLAEMRKGRSLCFSQDGDVMWLTGGKPTEFLGPTFDVDVQGLIKRKLIASDPDAGHWTAANAYDITAAGRVST